MGGKNLGEPREHLGNDLQFRAGQSFGGPGERPIRGEVPHGRKVKGDGDIAAKNRLFRLFKDCL
jgi:hypothetical protein